MVRCSPLAPNNCAIVWCKPSLIENFNGDSPCKITRFNRKLLRAPYPLWLKNDPMLHVRLHKFVHGFYDHLPYWFQVIMIGQWDYMVFFREISNWHHRLQWTHRITSENKKAQKPTRSLWSAETYPFGRFRRARFFIPYYDRYVVSAQILIGELPLLRQLQSTHIDARLGLKVHLWVSQMR